MQTLGERYDAQIALISKLEDGADTTHLNLAKAHRAAEDLAIRRAIYCDTEESRKVWVACSERHRADWIQFMQSAMDDGEV